VEKSVLMRRALTAAVLAGVVLAATGCGQDASRADVRAVAGRFYAAIASHDGSAACAQLSADTVKAVEQEEQGACAGAIAGVGLVPSRVVRVAVYVTNAKVDLANGASAFLEQTATGWKLSALGCRAVDGDPRQHPLSCTVEA
jgi:hypothetical protein